MHFYFFLCGDEELVRERMCCAIALSLSLIQSHSQNIQIKSLFGKGHTHTHTHARTHTHSLNMRIQNYHLNKKDKNGLLCFIHLGKQQKKKKTLCRLYITDTNQSSHICHSLSHSDTFTKIFTSITNPICLIFFVVFVISFLGKCKSSSFL